MTAETSRPWIERYKVVRRLVLAWAIWLITYVTLQLPWASGTISSGAAAAYATVVAILTAVFGIYFRQRHREDQGA
jgi:hypothetical protein